MPPKLIRTDMGELFPMSRRSKGKHVSAAIYKIMKAIHPDRFDDRPIDILRANLGNALEHAIVGGLIQSDPQRYVRPGELEHEDWYGTPDLWDLGPNHSKDIAGWTTIEIKMTWASLNRADDIESEWWWRYWIQLQAYCYMAGIRRGHLIICFVNGNYGRDPDDPNSGPQVRVWENEWTPEELLETWQMLKAQC